MLIDLHCVPNVRHVDSDIFELRYFGHCMRCTFCRDWCCEWGCDVNLAERDVILSLEREIQPFVRAPTGSWFEPPVYEDPEYPTGRYVRSAQHKGACVFRSESGRGCALHQFSLATGRDYHQVKPAVCWLFPVCWDQGVLEPSEELHEDLICKNSGPRLYDAVRSELAHYFGPAAVVELDAIGASLLGT